MKFEPIIGTDLSGHIGGVVASHNTYGPYFRKRVRPVNKRTPPQLEQRLALQIVSQAWRNLDPGVRSTWQNTQVTKTSASGRTVKLTGQAAWVFINLMRYRIGLTLIETPPTEPQPVTLTLPTAIATPPDTLELTFTDADEWNASDGGVIISGSAPLGPGIKFWQTFNAVGVRVNPGAAKQTFTYPNAFAFEDILRLRLHVSAPSGRQSIVVNQDVVAAAEGTLCVDVSKVVDNTALWEFDHAVTADGTAEPKLLIADAQAVVSTVQAGTKSVLVEYAETVTEGKAWSIAELPTHVIGVPAIAVPQSGLVS